jgi:hypothetical protein
VYVTGLFNDAVSVYTVKRSSFRITDELEKDLEGIARG